MQHFKDLHNDLGSIPLPGNTIRLLSVRPHICLETPPPCICAFLLYVAVIKMAAPFTAGFHNKILISNQLRLCLFVYFGGISVCVCVCGEAASYFRCIHSVLSFMSMLSWRLRRQAGESTSIFQQSFRGLFIDAASLVCLGLLTKHTSNSSPPSSVLCCQLYSLYLCIMYIHMYTVRKSVMLPM